MSYELPGPHDYHRPHLQGRPDVPLRPVTGAISRSEDPDIIPEEPKAAAAGPESGAADNSEQPLHRDIRLPGDVAVGAGVHLPQQPASNKLHIVQAVPADAREIGELRAHNWKEQYAHLDGVTKEWMDAEVERITGQEGTEG